MVLPVFGPSWQLDGVSFNTGADVDGFSFIVQSSDGWVSGLAPRPQLQPRPTANGDYRSSNYRASRVVTLKGLAESPTRQSRELMCDKLAQLCSDPDTLYPLVRTERTRELVAYVEMQGQPVITELPDGQHATFNLQVVASDPRKYSTLVKTAGPAAIAQAPADGLLWDGTAGTTGTEWDGPSAPATGTIWQATQGTSGVLSMTNNGTAETPVLFTVTAPPAGTLQNFSITEIGGASRRIVDGYTMAAADVITIDTGTGFTTLNGSAVSGRFTSFSLITIPKQSTVTVQFASSAPAAGATLLAQWQDAY